MIDAYVGLGSNLGDSSYYLEQAFKELSLLEKTKLVTKSSIYLTSPIGPEQPDYLNAVAKIETSLSPSILLHKLQQIEQAYGRVRQERWGARTLDLDILLYGDFVMQQLDLIIPHPELKNRKFVLMPLAEIAQELTLPDASSVKFLLAKVADQEVRLQNKQCLV